MGDDVIGDEIPALTGKICDQLAGERALVATVALAEVLLVLLRQAPKGAGKPREINNAERALDQLLHKIAELEVEEDQRRARDKVRAN